MLRSKGLTDVRSPTVRCHHGEVAVERCDVCIVGAGIAGLNALFVASRYLSRDQKVILVDRRKRVGGMWVDTYPYVRLHQPHGMFTAGNIEWTLGRERSYLATKGEVLDHFDHCLDVIRQRVRVDEYFGWTLESDDDAGGIQRITCRSADGRPVDDQCEATDQGLRPPGHAQRSACGLQHACAVGVSGLL